MFEILRDPMWQFVAVVLAIAAILVSIGLYRKQRRRKALSYEIISRTPLLSVKEGIKGKIEIFYDKKPVQQVHLIEVKIINSGNMPIRRTDFERPLSLSFGDETKILTAEIAKSHPDNLRTSINIEGEKVELAKTLFNEGDSVTLKMLVSKFGGKIIVDGRIVGVKEISLVRGVTMKNYVLAFVGFVCALVGGYAVASDDYRLLGVGLTFLSFILVFWSKVFGARIENKKDA